VFDIHRIGESLFLLNNRLGLRLRWTSPSVRCAEKHCMEIRTSTVAVPAKPTGDTKSAGFHSNRYFISFWVVLEPVERRRSESHASFQFLLEDGEWFRIVVVDDLLLWRDLLRHSPKHVQQTVKRSPGEPDRKGFVEGWCAVGVHHSLDPSRRQEMLLLLRCKQEQNRVEKGNTGGR
jgi:hypothetical protein